MNNFYSNEKIAELKIKDAIALKFKPHFKGWGLTHTYRAKNGFGALGIHEAGFILNKTCDSILDVIESKE